MGQPDEKLSDERPGEPSADIQPRVEALRQRKPAPGLVHHPDQDSQTTDETYRVCLKSHGIQESMNSDGIWYDNAPMESVFSRLKSERTHHRVYHTRDEARTDLFFYLDAFYNRRRRHSLLDYLSPEAHEQLYHHRQGLLKSPCPLNQGRISIRHVSESAELVRFGRVGCAPDRSGLPSALAGCTAGCNHRT